jgi:hypothetical protein
MPMGHRRGLAGNEPASARAIVIPIVVVALQIAALVVSFF